MEPEGKIILSLGYLCAEEHLWEQGIRFATNYAEVQLLLCLPLYKAMVVGCLALSRKDASLLCLSMLRVLLCCFILWFKKKKKKNRLRKVGEMLESVCWPEFSSDFPVKGLTTELDTDSCYRQLIDLENEIKCLVSLSSESQDL